MFTDRLSVSFGSRLGAGLALVLLTTAWVGAKPAGPSAPKDIDVRVLEAGLGELPFGADVEGISKWIGRRLERRWGPRIVKAVDDKERASLRAARDKELADVTGNEIVFDGRRTTWETSIIAGEFAAGTGESAYLWRDGEVVHVFFMHEAKLWKYARRVEGADGPFAVRLREYEAKLGPAILVEKESDVDGKQHPVSATWRGASYDVRAVNRRMLYGGDLFIIQDRAAATKLEALRAEVRARQGAGEDPLRGIGDFLLGPENE